MWMTGGICPFIQAFDWGHLSFYSDVLSIYILTIIVKFPTIIVLQRALLKKMWIRVKRLVKIRVGKSEKTRNKKDRAFAKKGENRQL